jgi:hypothetical protein
VIDAVTKAQVAQLGGKPVLYYFFNHSFRRQLTARSLFESYTKQLLYHLGSIGKCCPLDVILRLAEFYGPKQRPPSLDEVVDELLIPLLAIVSESTLIVDGVDECSQKEVQKLLTVFRRILADCSCRIFISCREDVDIAQRVPGAVRLRITPENTKADIELFIDHKIESMQRDRRISENEDMLIYIKQQLLNKADCMSVRSVHEAKYAKLNFIGFSGLNFSWNYSGTDALEKTPLTTQYTILSNIYLKNSKTYTRHVGRKYTRTNESNRLLTRPWSSFALPWNRSKSASFRKHL